MRTITSLWALAALALGAALLLAVAGAGADARAEEKPGAPDPLAGAKAGDWSYLRGFVVAAGPDGKVAPPAERDVVLRVAKVEGDLVSLDVEVYAATQRIQDGTPRRVLARERAETLRLARSKGGALGEILRAVLAAAKVEPRPGADTKDHLPLVDPKTGRARAVEFACRRLELAGEMPEGKVEGYVLVSSAIGAGGIESLKVNATRPGGPLPTMLFFGVAGYGSGEEVADGEKPQVPGPEEPK